MTLQEYIAGAKKDYKHCILYKTGIIVGTEFGIRAMELLTESEADYINMILDIT